MPLWITFPTPVKEATENLHGQKGDSANIAIMKPVGYKIATKAWKCLIITEMVCFEMHLTAVSGKQLPAMSKGPGRANCP